MKSLSVKERLFLFVSLDFEHVKTIKKMHFKNIILLLFLLPMLSLSAQKSLTENLIPRKAFFKQQDKFRVKLSQNGEFVFYQKDNAGLDSALYYIISEKPHFEKQFKYEGTIANWFPTSNNGLVVVVKKGAENHLFFTNLKTKKTKELEIFPFQRLQLAGTSFKFSNKVAIDVTTGDQSKDGLYLLDFYSNKTRRLSGKGQFSELFLDDNFSIIAGMQRNEEGGNTLFKRYYAVWDTIFKHPFNVDMFLGGFNKIISVSSDGKTIYATDNTNKDKTSLVSVDVISGEVTELLSDDQADILPFAYTIDKTGKPVAVVALYGDTKRHFLDDNVKVDFEYLEKEIDGNIGYIGSSSDDNFWLVRKMEGGPNDYYHFNRTTKTLTPLFNDYSHLDDYDLASRHALSVPTRDSLELPIHVYLPPGADRNGDGIPNAPLPTVIYIHGGPWLGVVQWNQWYHTRNFQLLANRGYAVVNMEFRSTSGLGKKMTDAGDNQWGEGMHEDIIDVVNYLANKRIGNPNRMAMWGWSYGGYATNAALTFAPNVFACGISMFGPADLYEFSKIPFTDGPMWRNRVGDPNTEKGEALLKKHSPTNYIDQIKSPLLLTTGSKDERVPQKHVDSFAKQLFEGGKETIYFYYPEEVHDYTQPESWISFWAIAEHFLQEHLGGTVEPNNGDVKLGNFKAVYGEEFIKNIK